MPLALTPTQLTWLDKLYEANCSNRATVAVPPSVFKGLQIFGYVMGEAGAAQISSRGSGAVVQMRLKAAEQEKQSKKKGKKSCSKNSSKNTDQETSSSPQFVW